MIHLVLIAKVIGGVAAVAAVGYGAKRFHSKYKGHVEACEEAQTEPLPPAQFLAALVQAFPTWGKAKVKQFRDDVQREVKPYLREEAT